MERLDIAAEDVGALKWLDQTRRQWWLEYLDNVYPKGHSRFRDGVERVVCNGETGKVVKDGNE